MQGKFEETVTHRMLHHDVLQCYIEDPALRRRVGEFPSANATQSSAAGTSTARHHESYTNMQEPAARQEGFH